MRCPLVCSRPRSWSLSAEFHQLVCPEELTQSGTRAELVWKQQWSFYPELSTHAPTARICSVQELWHAVALLALISEILNTVDSPHQQGARS